VEFKEVGEDNAEWIHKVHYGPMVGTCEHGSETAGCIQGGKSFE
jgi:hypothetical protein